MRVRDRHIEKYRLRRSSFNLQPKQNSIFMSISRSDFFAWRHRHHLLRLLLMLSSVHPFLICVHHPSPPLFIWADLSVQKRDRDRERETGTERERDTERERICTRTHARLRACEECARGGMIDRTKHPFLLCFFSSRSSLLRCTTTTALTTRTTAFSPV